METYKTGEILSMLEALPAANLLENEEGMSCLEAHPVMLYIDSVGYTPIFSLLRYSQKCSIWTFDKPLPRAPAALHVLA